MPSIRKPAHFNKIIFDFDFDFDTKLLFDILSLLELNKLHLALQSAIQTHHKLCQSQVRGKPIQRNNQVPVPFAESATQILDQETKLFGVPPAKQNFTRIVKM